MQLDTLYKIGVSIGIIAIYSLITWGLGAILSQDKSDDASAAISAWCIGLIMFLILAVFTLENCGLWGR